MDIFDRIAAAIAALKNGNDTELKDHVAAIDAHLSQLDGADADEQTRLSSIDVGLQKVADAVAPASADGGVAQPGGDGSSGAAAATGTGAAT